MARDVKKHISLKGICALVIRLSTKGSNWRHYERSPDYNQIVTLLPRLLPVVRLHSIFSRGQHYRISEVRSCSGYTHTGIPLIETR
jgi:hypothetical protein